MPWLTSFFALILFVASGSAWAASVTFSQVIDDGAVVPIDSLFEAELVEGDLLQIESGEGWSFVVTLKTAEVSTLNNKVFVGVDGEFQLLLTAGPDGSLVGSISDGFNTYGISSENAVPDSRGLDPGREQLPDETIPLEDPEEQEPDFLGEQEDDFIGAPLLGDRTIFPTYPATGLTLDVFVYYDRDLDNPFQALDYLAAYTNDIYDNMGVDTRVRIVGVERVDVAESTPNSDLLDDMREGVSPFTGLEATRRAERADLVHLVRGANADPSTSCGIAYISVNNGLGSRAGGLAVTIFGNSRCNNRTFAHETGHNLGALHERDQYEPGYFGAYDYSFGSRVAGSYRTTMAYGNDDVYPLYATHSWPEATCNGIPCGEPAGTPEAADNRRTIRNTKRLLAAYEGESFGYAAVQDYGNSGTCSSGKTWKGITVKNSSPFDLEVVYQTYLRADGSVYFRGEFDPGQFVIRSGRSSGWGYCGDGSDNPVGNQIREGFFVYENPVTGELFEGTRVFFDSDYDGEYATVRAAAGAGGSVIGNPSSHVREDGEVEIGFEPAFGYALSGVTGTCPGFLHANTYTVEPVFGDCWAVAEFVEVEGPSQIEQRFNDLLNSVMFGRGK